VLVLFGAALFQAELDTVGAVTDDVSADRLQQSDL